jgi:hypothetical protein
VSRVVDPGQARRAPAGRGDAEGEGAAIGEIPEAAVGPDDLAAVVDPQRARGGGAGVAQRGEAPPSSRNACTWYPSNENPTICPRSALACRLPRGPVAALPGAKQALDGRSVAADQIECAAPSSHDAEKRTHSPRQLLSKQCSAII